MAEMISDKQILETVQSEHERQKGTQSAGDIHGKHILSASPATAASDCL